MSLPQDLRKFKIREAVFGIGINPESQKIFLSKQKKGFTVFLTGLPGAGKSTIANILIIKLSEITTQPMILLDGDAVRNSLSKELGFSKHDRNLNIERIGFIASEVTKNGGIAICAIIAPYRAARYEVRQKIKKVGAFIEVYVATPLEVCESRGKELYAKARQGFIKNFTGINDPYEPPVNPEVVVDASKESGENAAHKILSFLKNQGLVDC